VQLAKPLKPSKKIVAMETGARSSCLSVGKKSFGYPNGLRHVLGEEGWHDKGTPTTAEKDEMGYASMCVVNILDPLASKRELTPLKRHRKHTSKSPLPDASLVPPTMAGTSVIEGLPSSLFA
jgi:hypothetical protein